MKGRVLSATYENGVSTVTKVTKYGTFTGSSKLQEEDRDIVSAILGGTFAEMKCDIQAYHQRARIMRERANGVRHAYNVVYEACYMSAGDDEPLALDDTLFRLARQADIADAIAEEAMDDYKDIRDSYPELVARILDQKRKIRYSKKI